jgi:hypothetical protein
VLRQPHLTAAAWAFLVGCAVALVVGCAGVRSGVPEEEQDHIEATNEQARSPEATASEEARCKETRSFHRKNIVGTYVTNDVPGCPTGGLLSGTDKQDSLEGMDGDDKIRGLGATDFINGGPGNDEMFGDQGNDILWAGQGNDVLYGGAGDDKWLSGLGGEDVIYGGDGNDQIEALDGQRDELYCGGGWDRYLADESGDRHFAEEIDYVDSSCEKEGLPSMSFEG